MSSRVATATAISLVYTIRENIGDLNSWRDFRIAEKWSGQNILTGLPPVMAIHEIVETDRDFLIGAMVNAVKEKYRLVIWVLVRHKRIDAAHQRPIKIWQFLAVAGQREDSILHDCEKDRPNFFAECNELLHKITVFRQF